MRRAGEIEFDHENADEEQNREGRKESARLLSGNMQRHTVKSSNKTPAKKVCVYRPNQRFFVSA